MSKLPQERAQRMLMDLISKPGNNECADCKASSPRWASYNIGILLCVSCASIHRKMGTHISKVKSVSLDQWTKEQVDTIRVTGNLNSNAIFNPNDIPPPTDLIHSERDSELEKYIRNKYQFRKFMQTNRGFSTSSTSKGTNSGLASTSSSTLFSSSPNVAAGRSRAKEMFAQQDPKASLSQPTIKSSPSAAVATSMPPAQPLLIDPITSSQTQQQPPLQILASAPPAVPQATAAPALASSLQTQPQSIAQGVWGDMMAIQSGPAPVLQQQQPFLFTQHQQQFLSPISGVGVGVTPTFTGLPASYGAMAPPGLISPVPTTPQSSLSPQMGAAMNGMMHYQATGMFTTPSPQILFQSTPSPSLFPPSSVQLQPPVQMQVPMMTAAPAYQSMQPHAVFQSMIMTQQQQQQQQQQQPFVAAMNQPLYTGLVPGPGSVHPQQQFAGMMNPGVGQQWLGNANTNPYAGNAPQGQWYG